MGEFKNKSDDPNWWYKEMWLFPYEGTILAGYTPDAKARMRAFKKWAYEVDNDNV